jgi:hypothetical protein
MTDAVHEVDCRSQSWFFILAHPGHELRAHHLLELTRPVVAVMTDGSGSIGASRLAETRALLAQVGARPASVFGAITDGEAYRALMQADPQPFQLLADRLAGEILESGATSVVVDAAEGFNPAHDVCHWIGRAALARAGQCGRTLQAFELDLVGHPDQEGRGLRLSLDDAAFARKMASTTQYRALAEEAAAAFARYGTDAFRVEFLRVLTDAELPPPTWVPHYEQVGEARVAAGRYPTVLRFGAHVRPVLASLSRTHAPGPDAAVAGVTAFERL